MFKRQSGGAGSQSSVETLLGRATHINGDVQFVGGLHLDGQVTGNVSAAEDPHAVLIVSETGAVDGSVQVAHVILNGAVRGDVLARDRVELGAQARVQGNVYYGVIEMAPGARIDGKLIHRPLDGQAALSEPTEEG